VEWGLRVKRRGGDIPVPMIKTPRIQTAEAAVEAVY